MAAFVRRHLPTGLVIALVGAAAAAGAGPAAAVVQPATVKPAIASGRLHMCALRSAGTVVCWGDNSYGELGDNTIKQSPVPVQVHGPKNKGVLKGVTALTAGNGFTCALLATKQVDCWGYGGNGELGSGSTARSLVPAPVHGAGNKGLLSGVLAISVANSFSCALLANKTVDCWGGNDSGQLGIHSNARILVPVAVHGVGNSGLLKGVAAIAAGSSKSPCALLATKTVVCWGANLHGVLGNNSTTASSVPVKVRGVAGAGFLSGVKAISGGSIDTACALMVDGTVDCWGYLASVGVNQSPGDTLTPLKVHGVGDAGFLGGVTAIADHSDTPCALLSTARVVCWGEGVFRLGNNSAGAGVVPVEVHSIDEPGILTGVSAISEAEVATCALLATKAVNCWGDNGNGELGNGTVDNSGRPVQVVGVNGVGFLSL